jgi:hypothetical protein
MTYSSYNIELTIQVVDREDPFARECPRDRGMLKFHAFHLYQVLIMQETKATPQDYAQVAQLQADLLSTKVPHLPHLMFKLTAQTKLADLEKRYSQESKLMLSAWHDLGSRTTRDHLMQALGNSSKRSGGKVVPQSWLGRQRRHRGAI